MSSRRKTPARREYPPRRGFKSYWFINGNLHKYIRRLPNDLVETYDFKEKKYKQYYSYTWESAKEKAYTIRDIAELTNRSVETIQLWKKLDWLHRGQKAWSLKTPSHDIAEFWTKDDVWQCYDEAEQIHIGRPRRDGLVTTKVLPRAEVRARLNGDNIVYIKKGGELIPIWKELT